MNRLQGAPLLQVIIGFYLLSAVGAAVSEESSPPDLMTSAGTATSKEATAQDSTDVEQGEFVLAPVPMLQPALGGGVVLVGMYFHPHDADRPANISGVAAGYTSTDSYLIGAAHDHHFKGDRWRLQAGGVTQSSISTSTASERRPATRADH